MKLLMPGNHDRSGSHKGGASMNVGISIGGLVLIVILVILLT